MAAKRKNTRKTTKTQPKPRTKRGRRPRIKIVVAQPAEMAVGDAPAPRQLVKVNSAVVRRRQKARAAGGAAPSKAVSKPRSTASRGAKAGTKKRGRKLSTTTQFILSQPGEMPAADVVAAAGKQGLELNAVLVHKVRSRYRDRLRVTARSDPKANASLAPTTSKATKPGGKNYRSASEFVREQPIDMPAREVVAKAAKVGLNFSQGLVRVIRFHMRHGRDGESAAVGRGAVRRGRPPKSVGTAGVRRGRPPAAARAVAAPSSGEVEFRRLVVELGTGRAKALVTEVEKALEALISG
jgi:hypothetical protein